MVRLSRSYICSFSRKGGRARTTQSVLTERSVLINRCYMPSDTYALPHIHPNSDMKMSIVFLYFRAQSPVPPLLDNLDKR